MLQHSSSVLLEGSTPELNFDSFVSRIPSLLDYEKRVLAFIISGDAQSLPTTMNITKTTFQGYKNRLFAKLGVPYGPDRIRCLYAQAGGLTALGQHQAASVVIARLSEELQTLAVKSAQTAAKKGLAEAKKTILKEKTATPRIQHPITDTFRDELLAQQTNLRAFAISLCGNADRANDLVQETFLRAIANHDSYQPGSNFPAWLFTILRNLFRSEYRKRRREVEDSDGSYAKTLKTQPEQTAHMEFEEFRAAFDKLPPDQREALMLVGASGFTYEDAAAICGCAVGTIKSRVNRARMRVAIMLRIKSSEDLSLGSSDAVTKAVVGGG